VAVALSGANYLWILVTALLTVLGMWARALRWQLLFYPLRDLPFGKIFAVLNIGYLLTNILPARLGDLARAYLLGDLTGVSKARTLSTIIVERVADVLVILLFLAALLPFIPVPDWVTQSSVLLAGGFIGLAAMLVLMARHRQAAMSLLKRLAAHVQWLNREGLWHLLESLLDGVEILRYWRPALLLLVGSIFIWLLSVGQFYAAMLAFDLQLPVSAAVFVLCVTALGMTVPSSPGEIGVWEYVIVLGLSLFLVSKGTALSYALVLHATIYLTTTVMGVLSLWKESLALSILRQEVLPGGKA
jgi:glycosyltransferase 2 family protein